MSRLDQYLKGVRKAAIAGHMHPDGDCIGSAMGMYLYLRDNYPGIEADVYLEQPKPEFSYISGIDRVKTELSADVSYDILILTDISSPERIGVAGPLAEQMENIICFDHHVTNDSSYKWLFNEPQASSACEVIWKFMDEEKITKDCAEALYTGIAHDTGIFQYSNTSPETMRIAAKLMEKGIDHSKIINDSYYQKSYVENQVMGRALLESILMLNGKIIVSYVSRKTMQFYGIGPKDLDGIVAQLRNTKGVEVAIFLYETDTVTYKVSLRSKDFIDVSIVAAMFGGGGHKKAAGCTMHGTHLDVINNLVGELSRQF